MEHFVPSDETPPLRILPDVFPRLPPSAARAAIELHTQPGDTIVDPFCIGVGAIQAAIDSGRRIVAASFNPIAILAIEATLWPIDARAAFTHLADARTGPERLRDHVMALYATRCPTCGQAAIALAFSWDRDQNAPIDKRVQCETCGENVGPVDTGDLANARRFEPRGLPYWLLLGHVVDRKSEDAERVSEVLDAYTPRSQSAINDILLKFEGLAATDRAALRPPILAMLEACTSLHSVEEGVRRPIGLKPPGRFVEKNVWLELDFQVSRTTLGTAPAPRAPTAEALAGFDQPAVCLLAEPVRELARLLPAESIPLVISYPPLPRPALWSLSTVWAAWLWGKPVSDLLLPLLSRKRTNWDWQWRAISSALNQLRPALRTDAHSVMVFDNDTSILESVALAAAGANCALEHAVCDPHDGARLTWRVEQSAIAPSYGRDLEALAIDIRALALDAATRSLYERAEPTPWLTLQSGIYAALGHSDVLAIAARLPEGDPLPLAFVRDTIQAALTAGDASLLQIETDVWWLKEGDARHSALLRAALDSAPLADRVELITLELLRSREEWASDELLREIYRRLPGHLTPDRSLVATCLHSYTEDEKLGRVRLRPEDSAEARAAETVETRGILMRLGLHFGFEVKEENKRLIWSQAGQVSYTFVIKPTAEVAVMLYAEPGVLVLPGGRATLLQHKIARDARLRHTNWQVLKCSSLRHIAGHADLTLNTFTLAFGLEPPIEQPQAQIGLWGLVN